MRARTLTYLTILAVLVAGCSRGKPTQAPVTGSFVATIGAGSTLDTVAVEQYTLTADSLTGESVVAYPRATTRTYTAVFGPDGQVQHVHIVTTPAGGGLLTGPSTTADYTYGPDSVTVVMTRDTVTRRYAVATGSARPLPFYEDLFAFWERAVAREMKAGVDTATFGMLAGRHVQPITFKRVSATAADFGFPEWGMIHAELSSDHRFMRLDMTGTTNKYTVTQAAGVDVQAMAKAWAKRPQPGQLSPRDTARASVGAAHVLVDYGRPSMRGRKVFGGIVPWGQVWRTGANAATQLITDRDLVIGGTTVPAGTYSIFSLPTQKGWTLIINKQHGQWGTVYHADRDFARVPMTVTQLAQPVERFTITVSRTGADRGALAFEWARTKGTVGFRVK